MVHLRNFIIDEVEADVVCLQNKVIGENHVNWLPNYRYKAWYKAKKTIRIGYDITPKTNKGDFTIKPSGDIVVYAGESIEVPPGWESLHVHQGATWHAYIYDDGCDYHRSSQHSSHETREANNTYDIAEHLPIAEQNEPTKEEVGVMTLYPNPNNGSFIINFPEEDMGGEVRITSLSGKTIISQLVESTKMEIRKESLSSGVYFVIWIRFGGEKQTLKAIVQ